MTLQISFKKNNICLNSKHQKKLFKFTEKSAFVSIFAIFFSAIIISILTAIYVLLIRQIQMMEIDAESFQALYVADSAFECMVLKEQNNANTESVLFPANSGNLGDCTGSSDLSWVSVPTAQAPQGQSVRAKSIINLPFTAFSGEFCAIMNADVETADSSQWLTPPSPNLITISGHNKACGSPNQKVVERVIDFYF